MVKKIQNLRLMRRLHKIRKSMSTQLKLTILTALGFTLVFIGVGTFIDNQFRTVIYTNPIMRVRQPFSQNQVNQGVVGSETIDYSYLKKEKINIPNDDRVYIMYYNKSWYMFFKHGNQVSYQNIDLEHEIVESFSSRLLIIFTAAELLLLIMAIVLARANMVPIKRVLKQQRTFVADAAHEFKTPMTIIQNKLETMLEHPNDSVIEQVENVANALTEVRHLNKLTADMLKLAQADAEIAMFYFEPMDLVKVVTEINEILAVNTENRHQTLTLDLPDEVVMDGDIQRLRQLIMNLVDNAQKYAGENSEVKIVVKKGRNVVHLQVVDTGEGISEDDKQHLFDRFYRVDKSRSRASGGHGLGLSIVKWIVDGHSGTIDVSNTIPHGTTFNITLPLKQKG
ncbi:HAMP domain-containing histidine kinase [Weissella diestrammenae]|uniref:histidine kinase n=1 Tax=Weissella diestrammenae TaxID=1162633 RepID=A0A7G9T7C6_9LACO|nr:HAMP domain-containing sensor histidine kinase [Weissella diestrammenae]MCM0582014.1 HAMP domain-containing histidine kinase [Weissella diestrammenae]QNN76001.1 HAMP domain-containing histidine kinase [Weissella diestrammenae]